MSAGEEPLISTGQAARRLGVSPRTLQRWVADGLLRPTLITPTGRYLFRWSEVAEQLRKRPPGDRSDS